VVRGRLSALRIAVAAAVAAALIWAPTALGANQRVAISDYRWSEPELQLDLGEHVTWYWTGPDTMHSVTGVSPNARGIESDPDVSMPNHPVGDSFQVSFDEPGLYSFHCRLHSSVRGTVEVSPDPGDPITEPDPIPPNRVDATPPLMTEVRLASPSFRRGRGILHLALGERATVNAEYWKLRRRGVRPRRDYRGWQEWSAHIGYNDLRFATRGPRFNPRPGRYVAIVDATDASSNTGRAHRLHFSILP
jgi:plastocyanin